MALNLVMIAVGVVICFGGIYFRRLIAALLGFIWGVLGSAVFALLVLKTSTYDLQQMLLAFLLAGLVTAVLSAIFYKLCAAINGFLSVFTLALILMAAAGMESGPAVLAIALVAAIAAALLCYKFHEYAFIILTAFLGGLLAGMGGYALAAGREFSEVCSMLIWRDFDELAPILAGAVGLGIVGFFVQRRRVKKRRR